MFDPENQKLRNIYYEVILADLISTSYVLPGRGFQVGRVLWSNSVHSHLSSQGSPPACTPLGRFLPASAGTHAGELQLRSASDAGVLVQPPLCTQQQLDWTLYLPMCTLGRNMSTSHDYWANETVLVLLL